MKVAIPTNDKLMVSDRFGRSNYFTILTVEGGSVKSRVYVVNEEYKGHRQLHEILKDCNAVICRHLGPKIFAELKDKGIEVYLVKEPVSIGEAVEMFISGRLKPAEKPAPCGLRKRNSSPS